MPPDHGEGAPPQAPLVNNAAAKLQVHNNQRTTAGREDGQGAPALFEAVVERNAYGTETTFSIPPYVSRGPGRRTTTGPQDAQAAVWWWREAMTVVLDVVNAGGTICSDDLHDAFPEEPSASGAAFGGLFSRLAHEGRIVEVGMVKSRRPAAHRRRIITWGRP